MDDTLLTTEEMLAYLHVNLRTLCSLIQADKIPAVRVGRQWRCRKRDLDAWLDAQRPPASRPAQAPAKPFRVPQVLAAAARALGEQ